VGACNESGAALNAGLVVRAMAVQRDRGNGLGAGFAGYGIYPVNVGRKGEQWSAETVNTGRRS